MPDIDLINKICSSISGKNKININYAPQYKIIVLIKLKISIKLIKNKYSFSRISPTKV
jgi:hypothetical protein